MKAYSMDLRERVVAACDRGEGTREADRQAVLRQRRLGVPAAATAARHRLDRPEAPRRRPAARLRGRGRRAAPPGGRGLPRRHAGGAARGRRRRLRHLGGLPRPGAAGPAAKKKSERAAEQDRPELKAEREAWRAEFAAHRPGPAGVRGRDRHEHGDGPPLRPGPARRAGRRPGAARPLEGGDADGRDPARRRGRLPGVRRGHGRGDVRGVRRAGAGPDAAAAATSW